MNFEGKQQSLLTFRIGPVLCCAPCLPVQSIIPPPKLTHPPGSDSSQPGIFKHGKHIIKVLDLRQKFGVELSEQTQPGNLIITIFENENFAFWVDQILDVFDFPTTGWGDLPAAIPRGVFSRTLLLNKKIHLYSEFEKLATINDLGYLKHYIQQLTENQNKEVQSNEQQAKETKTKGSIINEPIIKKLKIKEPKTNDKPVILESKKEPLVTKNTIQEKPTEIKTNLYSYINTPVIKKDNNTATASTISKPLEKNSTQTIKPKMVNESHTKIKKPPFAEQTVNRNKLTKPTTKTTQTFKSINEKENIKSHLNKTAEEESFPFGIIILFILILSSLGGGTYFLFSSMVSSDYKETTNPPFVQPTVESTFHETPYTEPDNFQETYSVPNELNTEPEVHIKEKEDKPVDGIDKNEDIAYRADISQQDNDITITLHQPVESAESKHLEVAPQQLDELIIDEKPVASPDIKELQKEELKNIIKPEKIIKEIIHTVVRGDTLWAIAKKYVNNPFLYPELARLSNIKNPHRIYPGNRVRIRFIAQ